MPKIFINPAGQRDNLGDSVLRRPYLQALRRSGELHVLVGHDADYNSALALLPGDVQYSSRVRWILAAIVSVLRGNAVFAVNAGEVVGTSSERKHGRWQIILGRLARAKSAPIVIAGVSVRPGSSVRDTWLKQLSANAEPVYWRDTWTRDQVGVGKVAPDWAFAVTENDPSLPVKRDLLAVAMRADRPIPSDRWFRDIRTIAEELNARVVVVVQVKRDAERAQVLALRLDAELVEWASADDHATQETIVRDVYGRAHLVISDRIHALIIGATEGAAPAGSTTDGSDKIRRTFAAVTELPVAPADEDNQLDRWRTLVASQETLREDLAGARDNIAEVCAGVADTIGARFGAS